MDPESASRSDDSYESALRHSTLLSPKLGHSGIDASWPRSGKHDTKTNPGFAFANDLVSSPYRFASRGLCELAASMRKSQSFAGW